MLPWHPLINKTDSPHYDREDGKVGIEEMEKETTLREMIGFSRCSMFKYKFRLGSKDDIEKEKRKIESYELYLGLLYTMLRELKDEHYYVDVAMRRCNIKLRYK